MSELITDRSEVLRIIADEGDDAVQCRYINVKDAQWRPVWWTWLEAGPFKRLDWRRTPKPVPPGDLTWEEAKRLHEAGEPVEYLWPAGAKYWTRADCWFSNMSGVEEAAYRRKPAPKRVPLGPEDVKPGSVFRWDCWGAQKGMQHSWAWIYYVGVYGIVVQIALNCSATSISWAKAMDGGSIKRPGEDWKPCWKEATE
jgi:hypothetical protein